MKIENYFCCFYYGVVSHQLTNTALKIVDTVDSMICEGHKKGHKKAEVEVVQFPMRSPFQICKELHERMLQHLRTAMLQ